ncbi:MAG TPA: cellulose synthase operon protein YhjQ/BcsQ [Bryobacteraceae bacterium]|jgi:cellulose biosynthesis protein BcsQ|nr:cellulose synthase operon protein YhjQ/BcsQ [Bryobacteraceae bacterium]
MAHLAGGTSQVEGDDVATLCSVAKIDPSGYRRFPAAMKLKADAGGVKPKAPDAAIPTPSVVIGLAQLSALTADRPEASPPAPTAVPDSPASLPKVLAKVSSPEIPVVPQQAAPEPNQKENATKTLYTQNRDARVPYGGQAGGSRGTIHRVLKRNMEDSGAVWTPGAATRMLAVYPVAGGVGCTTLLATLARISSTMGEEITLVDRETESQLSYFFGGDALARGISYFEPQKPTEGIVHVLTTEGEVKRGRTDLPLDRNESWMWRRLAQFGDQSDRILIDAATTLSERTQRRLLAGGTCLAVLVPDLRCMIAVGRILKFFTGWANILRRPLVPYFVLNQFDPDIPFHVDAREELRRQLGDKLLPVEIPRSDVIAEAAAEGMTVVDFAPTSDAAENFFALSDRIRAVTPATDYRHFETDW